MVIDFYLNILDNDERGIIILDLEGTLVYKNNKTDLLLRKKENFIEKLFENYIEPLISDLSFSDFKLVFSEDGIEFKAKKVLFQKKIFIFIIFEKRGNQSIAENKKMETTADSIFFNWQADIKNSRFSYVFISKGFEKITGYKTEDIYKGETSLPELVFEEDWPIYEEYLLNILSHKPSIAEYRIKTRDGKIITLIEQTIPSINQKGDVIKINGFTMKKVAFDDGKIFLNTIFDALKYIRHSIVITDKEGDILYVNQAFTKITGFSYEEAIGENPRILKSGKHDKLFYEKLWATISAGKVWDGEIINKTKKGDFIIQELTITPIQNRFGEIYYYMAIEKDITEKIKLEEQIYQSQKLEAVGLLAGGIAHSFNNILAGILGFTNLLKKRNSEDKEIVKILDKMSLAGERAIKLVSQLLGYARKGKMLKVEIDLEEQIKEVFDLITSTKPENIEMEKIIEEEKAYTIGDPDQIKQVIMNVSINAIQAMPDGGRLTYHLYKRKLRDNNKETLSKLTKGEYFVVAVEDTGIGIKEENRYQVFLPFFTTAEKNNRQGLGLSTVYGIMKNHKGDVVFDSKEGKGSIFYLYFPAVKKSENKDKQGIIKRQNIKVDIKERGEILIVDDEVLIREMLKEALTESGYSVIQAKDGEEGYNLYKEKKDNILLTIMDLNMPKKNGRELFYEMKKLDKNIKVLIITGYTLNEQVQELLDNGAIDCFKKPFKIPSLLEKVNEVVIKKPMGGLDPPTC